MVTIRVVCRLPVGLHARPAAEFTQLARSFQSDAFLRNVTEDGEFADAKRPIQVLAADVLYGQVVELEIEGSDEGACARALQAFLSDL